MLQLDAERLLAFLVEAANGTEDGAAEEPLDVPTAGRRLGVCEATAWKLLRTGELPSYKVGRRRFVRASDVDKYVQSRTVVGWANGDASAVAAAK